MHAPVPEMAKRRCCRPRKVTKTVPEHDPEDVVLQWQVIQEDDLHLDDVEDMYDLLAEQRQMQCSDWECA